LAGNISVPVFGLAAKLTVGLLLLQ
ncbi:unnamed protein product, partial [Allacma fusca]